MNLLELEQQKDELVHRIAERERHLLALVGDVRTRVRRARSVAVRLALGSAVVVGLWTAWRVYRRIRG